jgi:hypothetical protein
VTVSALGEFVREYEWIHLTHGSLGNVVQQVESGS